MTLDARQVRNMSFTQVWGPINPRGANLAWSCSRFSSELSGYRYLRRNGAFRVSCISQPAKRLSLKQNLAYNEWEGAVCVATYPLQRI